MDDYYLNLLDWGSNNVIAVALNNSVYLWHASDGKIDNLVTLEGNDDYITRYPSPLPFLPSLIKVSLCLIKKKTHTHLFLSQYYPELTLPLPHRNQCAVGYGQPDRCGCFQQYDYLI